MAEKILIISPVSLIPHHSGNKKRIRSICTELMNMGYELDLFYTGFDEGLDQGHSNYFNGNVLNHRVGADRLTFVENPVYRTLELFNGLKCKFEKIRRRFAESIDSARYNKSVYEYKNIRKFKLLESQLINHSYKAVIVNYAVYSFYFDLFEDHVIKILDTHDRLTDRYKLFLNNGLKPIEWYSLSYHDEKKALSRADIIWAITPAEQNHYQEMISDHEIDVLNLRHITRFKRIETSGAGKRVLMTGSDNKLNQDGLRWFLDHVWPGIISDHPDAELIVAGSICNIKNTLKENQGVNFFGRYESDESVYALADICINPMQEGTGLKIKTLEALAYGKQVISTYEGATGLDDLTGKGLICLDDPAEWIDQLNRNFRNNIIDDKQIEITEKVITGIYHENISVIHRSLS